MLVLIATDELQGSSPHDHHSAVDGELVTPVALDCADPHCDVCARAWFGLVSHGATTTAMVVDRPGVTAADLRRRVHEWLDCAGTIDLVVQAAEADGDDPVAVVADLVDAHIAEIRLVCASYPVGTIVSRLGVLVSPRRLSRAA
jgi:hypothetical protein